VACGRASGGRREGESPRQLQLQGDPNALELLVTELRKRGFNNTADQVEGKAQQIRTMLDAARTMHDIDNEFKSPGTREVPLLKRSRLLGRFIKPLRGGF